ncbi:MAG TPA: hypothetical protein VFJ19_05065 [Nocardioidaceae bacterium]|nr:hypothetical protein [Nocardioidaceae bacterium]
MRPEDEDVPWIRQLPAVLGGLLVVALLVGAVIAVIGLSVAKLTGIGSAAAGPTDQTSLFVPSQQPTTRPQVYPFPSQSSSPHGGKDGTSTGDPSVSESSPSPSPTHTRQPPPISLQAYPLQVSPGARIHLTGVYSAGEGAVLQVQEMTAGHWADFPVTATVSGGAFTTYVITSHTGPTKFRMLDRTTGRHSGTVTVQIG